jgi:hypothetical protein
MLIWFLFGCSHFIQDWQTYCWPISSWVHGVCYGLPCFCVSYAKYNTCGLRLTSVHLWNVVLCEIIVMSVFVCVAMIESVLYMKKVFPCSSLKKTILVPLSFWKWRYHTFLCITRLLYIVYNFLVCTTLPLRMSCSTFTIAANHCPLCHYKSSAFQLTPWPSSFRILLLLLLSLSLFQCVI